MAGQTRGRMSRIDQLPAGIKARIDQMLRDGVSQLEILRRLEEPLRDAGEEPISRSGLNRYSTRVSEDIAEMREYRAIADVWTAKFGDAPQSELMPLLREVISTLAYDYAIRARRSSREDEAAQIDIKGLSQVALLAQRLERSAEMGLKREKQMREAHAREMAEQLEQAEQEADPIEAIRRIREDLYGIYDVEDEK